ncbi:MAG: PAS domain S-box protein, partial [Halanaeroarchaeum sp.]
MTSPRSEIECKGVIRSAPDAIVLADADTGRIVEANDAAADLFDRPIETLVGHPQTVLHPAADRERYRRLFEEQVEAASSIVSSFDDGSPVYAVRGDGEQFPVEINAWLLDTDDGPLLQGVFRDVSRRRERERQRRQYRQAVQSAADPMAAIDDEFRLLFVNRSYRELVDAERTPVEGDHLRSLVGEETFADIGPYLERALEGETVRFDSTRHVDDTRREFEVTYASLSDEAETVVGVVGSMHDVTTRNDVQRTLEERTEQLTVLNRLVRHDIRNDVAVALGWAEELEDHVDAEGEEMLARIQENATHVVELTRPVRDLVDTIGAGEEPPLEPIDLATVLDRELTKRRSLYPAADFVVYGDVPAVSVTANQMLSSVFRNVLNNAVQHNDTPSPTVTIDVERGDDVVRVRVADDGPGIPDGRKESLFGAVDEGITAEASGVGLALVSTLVHQYGGRVHVEDNEPRGAVFVVELPV